MLCVRCSHPLPPRADRCVRCFALNRTSEALIDSFDDEPLRAIATAGAVTEPEVELEPESGVDEHWEAAALAAAPKRVTAPSLLLAWALDAILLAAFSSACILATLHLAAVRYPLDFLRDTSALWLALVAALAFSYSFLFALAGRTPGMALAGHRLQTVRGDPPSLMAALVRALLALPSAALGLYGFFLALFDPRRQTLHDKLCGCVVIVD